MPYRARFTYVSLFFYVTRVRLIKITSGRVNLTGLNVIIKLSLKSVDLFCKLFRFAESISDLDLDPKLGHK